MTSTKAAKPPPEPFILRGHEAGVQALAFLCENHGTTSEQRSDDFSLLASGDADGHVKLWDMGACRPCMSWIPARAAAQVTSASPSPATMKGVLSLHAFNQGRSLLTQVRGGTVSLWDLGNCGGTPQSLRSWATGSFHFCKVSVGEVGDADRTQLLLAPTVESEQFQLWDMREGSRPVISFTPPGPQNRGLCMCLKLLLSGTRGAEDSNAGMGHALAVFEDGSLHGWDLRMLATNDRDSFKYGTGDVAAFSVKLAQKETPLCLDVAPSRRRGILGAAGADLVTFDLDLALHHCQVRQCIALKHPGVGDVKIREDEGLWAVGGWDHRVRFFRWQDGAPLAVLRGHGASVNALTFSPGLKTLVSGGKDARIALWEKVFPPLPPPRVTSQKKDVS